MGVLTIKIISTLDGLITYDSNFIRLNEIPDYLEKTKTLPLKQHKVIIQGMEFREARLTYFAGDAGLSYTYSGVLRHAEPWSPELIEFRNKLKDRTGYDFNSCLINYYRDGTDSISAHSDNEQGLGPNRDNIVIASISLGGPRRMIFKHRPTKEVIELNLESGSLLLMEGKTQRFWSHEIPKTKTNVKERISLTYRLILS